MMNYELEGTDPVILRLSGEVNLHDFRSVRHELTSILAGGADRMIVNLTKVTSIDSSSIGTLFSIRETLTRSGGRFVIGGMSDSVRTVLNLTNIFNLFEIAESESKALVMLS